MKIEAGGVGDPSTLVFRPGEPVDDALLDVLLHMACADGHVREEEIDLLAATAPHLTRQVMVQRIGVAEDDLLDVDVIARALPREADRWRAMRLAARMAWTDRELATREKMLLLELASGFEFPRSAVELVLAEVVGRVRGPVSPERVKEALEGFDWESLTPDERAVSFDGGERPLVRVLVGGDQIAILPSGFSGPFREGKGFVGWTDVTAYSRVPVFGASVKLTLNDGQGRTLVDPRLRVLGALFDRVYGE